MFGVSKVGASILLLAVARVLRAAVVSVFFNVMYSPSRPRLAAGSAKPLCGALCMNKVYSIHQGSEGSAGGMRAGLGEVRYNTPTYCPNHAYRLAGGGFAEGWP
jgi:hypothetical protein